MSGGRVARAASPTAAIAISVASVIARPLAGTGPAYGSAPHRIRRISQARDTASHSAGHDAVSATTVVTDRHTAMPAARRAIGRAPSRPTAPSPDDRDPPGEMPVAHAGRCAERANAPLQRPPRCRLWLATGRSTVPRATGSGAYRAVRVGESRHRPRYNAVRLPPPRAGTRRAPAMPAERSQRH